MYVLFSYIILFQKNWKRDTEYVLKGKKDAFIWGQQICTYPYLILPGQLNTGMLVSYPHSQIR